MNWDNFVQPLGWTLLHFVWQGAVVAALFGLGQAFLRNRSANTRYLSGCAALLLMALVPIVTFCLHKPVVSLERPIQPTLTVVAESHIESGEIPFSHESTKPLAAMAGPVIVEVGTTQQINQRLEQAFPWLVVAWLVGVFLLSVRLLIGWLRVRTIRLRGVEEVEPALRIRFARLCEQLQISRPVRVLKSVMVEVPTMIGWLKPVVLLPASSLCGLTPAQLEAVLVHELAHIRRHDFLVNLLQSLLETVLFYHPAVWWISRKVREEREHCCDDLVVQISGDRINYVRALATLEELRSAPTELAMTADGGSLLGRIQRMLGSADEKRSSTWISGAFVLGIVSLLVIGNSVRAQFSKNEETEASAIQVDAWSPEADAEAMESATRVLNGDFAALEQLKRKYEVAFVEFKKTFDNKVFKPLDMAFDYLGSEAGKGNTNALEGLLRSAAILPLTGSATHGLGIAAGQGNQGALNALLAYDRHGILQSSAVRALKASADRGNAKAIQFLIQVAQDSKASPLHHLVAAALTESAAQQNEAAIDALIHLSQKTNAGIRTLTLEALTRAANNGSSKAAEAVQKMRDPSLLEFRLVSRNSFPGMTEELVETNGNERRIYHVEKEVCS